MSFFAKVGVYLQGSYGCSERFTDFPPLLALPANAPAIFTNAHTGIQHSAIQPTEQLLKRAEDVMREDQEYLKNFNAAVEALQKDRQSSRLNIVVSRIAIHYPAHGFSGAIQKPAGRESRTMICAAYSAMGLLAAT